MAEEAYEKYEKTQGNGTWGEERLQLSNTRKDTMQLRFSKIEPHVRLSTQRHCG